MAFASRLPTRNSISTPLPPPPSPPIPPLFPHSSPFPLYAASVWIGLGMGSAGFGAGGKEVKLEGAAAQEHQVR